MYFSLKHEQDRLALQKILDAGKDHNQRNRLGQFSTPPALAKDIVSYGLSLLSEDEVINFLDPAFGTGVFYSALCQLVSPDKIQSATGFEIDYYYAQPSQELWSKAPLQIYQNDFTKIGPFQTNRPLANLLICNPPYVRHHYLSSAEKERLYETSLKACGLKLSGLAGLYCYFLLVAHLWMAPNCLAGWLIPSEFMDVNYGLTIRNYLLEKVTLLRVHSFEPNDRQFCDALVSSTVIWFRNTLPPNNHNIEFSFSGSFNQPKLSKRISLEAFKHESKWSRFCQHINPPRKKDYILSDFFKINRGLATGSNDFFILTPEEIEAKDLPWEFFLPILPSARYLKQSEILADKKGNPILDKPLFLLNCRLPESIIRQDYPQLWHYFQIGYHKGIHQRYLCKKRNPWYLQELRKPPLFICTYMGRSNNKKKQIFRFILNHSQAVVANSYLALYPHLNLENSLAATPQLKHQVWKILNQITVEELLNEGRVYGGGLHKLEPKELSKVPVNDIASLII